MLNWKFELESDSKVTITWGRARSKALSFVRLVYFILSVSVLLVLGIRDRNRSDYLGDYKPLMCLSSLGSLAWFFFFSFSAVVLNRYVTFRYQMHLCIITIWEERRGRWLVHYWLRRVRVRAGSKLHADLVASFLWWRYRVRAQNASLLLAGPLMLLGDSMYGAVVVIFLFFCISWAAVLYFAGLVWAFVSSLTALLPLPQLLLLTCKHCQPPLILPCFPLPVPKLNFTSWRMRTVSLLCCELFLR